MDKQPETYSYKGWLNSDSFLKRAFAVLGYSMAATFILYFALGIIALLIGILFSFSK